MKVVPREQSAPRPDHARHVCNVCGEPSEMTICDECSERLRVEALNRKKHEEQVVALGIGHYVGCTRQHGWRV
jgi:hypothetical protein